MQPSVDRSGTSPRKILACRAVAHHLERLAGPRVELAVLDIGLHVKPDGLREKLQAAIDRLSQSGAAVLLGYGLCGRATEGLVSRSSTLVLPRVDDCVGALLGSRTRHRMFMKENPGCYFLEPTWVAAEVNVFVQLERDMGRIPVHRREEIARLTLAHYRSVAMLTGPPPDAGAGARGRGYAARYGLHYREVATDLGLLARLVHGPWEEDEFVVCPPGVPIPLF